ncbi:hypothetical protein [Candidatus Odyssella thessalonicensis]|uniref:hypothetical protein n=1 Tax=Candidatus Odyssella thessalonicensis TaxID=84647 RepID=UPI000225ACA8|nr:hypothetical protein [Candidatus Odyssella thessalonicensis]
MKSYFSDILKPGVLGVPRCSQTQELRNTADFKDDGIRTPINNAMCSWCSIEHSRTPAIFQSVPLKAREGAMENQVHLVTPENNDLRYFFEERASILEYDSYQTRSQAEYLASAETVLIFLKIYHSQLLTEFYRLINYLPTENTHDTN